MFIPVEQRPEISAPSNPSAATTPASALADDGAERPNQPSVEPPEVTEELLIEEVSIDGMCGVY